MSLVFLQQKVSCVFPGRVVLDAALLSLFHSLSTMLLGWFCARNVQNKEFWM